MSRFSLIGRTCASVLAALALASAQAGNGQGKTYERTFQVSPATVEKLLQQMQGSMSGHLPVLDGFALAGDHPLDRYQRPYFQANAQVSASPAGGCLVRVNSKITAWYSDAVPSLSGYRLLLSNGRIEGDILDQLSDQLAPTESATDAANRKVEAVSRPINVASPQSNSVQPDSAHRAEAEAVPSRSWPPASYSSSLTPSLSAAEKGSSQESLRRPPDAQETQLRAELEQLQEALKNQSHPRNLAAVKKSGTAVVSAPSLNAKTLFLASAHDEFEMLNYNQDWVHVRISGLSRGWIWRNDLEMPGDIPDTQAVSTSNAAEDMFRVIREETAPFPGDWAQLRGDNVRIISVEKADESAKDYGPAMKLEFAKLVFDKNYSEIAQKSPALAGIVLIFDSADGGMIAASTATLAQWKAGNLSDGALWHNCFFDPPETFLASGPSATR